MNSLKYPYELFGIECDVGWKHLYEPLMARCKAEGVEIAQVKEKFGGLRFYVLGGSADLHEAIHAAEEASFLTCEVCGEPGIRRNDGWIKTLCDAHAVERSVRRGQHSE